jgi:hypothetical protein
MTYKQSSNEEETESQCSSDQSEMFVMEIDRDNITTPQQNHNLLCKASNESIHQNSLGEEENQNYIEEDYEQQESISDYSEENYHEITHDIQEESIAEIDQKQINCSENLQIDDYVWHYNYDNPAMSKHQYWNHWTLYKVVEKRDFGMFKIQQVFENENLTTKIVHGDFLKQNIIPNQVNETDLGNMSLEAQADNQSYQSVSEFDQQVNKKTTNENKCDVNLPYIDNPQWDKETELNTEINSYSGSNFNPMANISKPSAVQQQLNNKSTSNPNSRIYGTWNVPPELITLHSQDENLSDNAPKGILRKAKNSIQNYNENENKIDLITDSALLLEYQHLLDPY